jgi:glycosyltransferase involved in cell wall biosynthesis
VLFLGRVTFQKGPDYFLEAAARVVAIEPHVKFVMSGSGDMLPKMVERAARLGLARHVHFTGFLKGGDVERMYAMADIYVMPSVSEPFGISPLEAMALDVPVIVSRQSGVAEVCATRSRSTSGTCRRSPTRSSRSCATPRCATS